VRVRVRVGVSGVVTAAQQVAAQLVGVNGAAAIGVDHVE
jgi:hypothetical protein